MASKYVKIVCVFTVLCLSSLFAYAQDKLSQEIKQPTTIVKNTIEEEKESTVLSPVIDEIALKQKEMRDTIVLVETQQGNGSGTIIDRLETDVEEIFEYRVLTNEHVTNLRFITFLQKVNSLTGKVKTEIVETKCKIIVFDHPNEDWNQYDAKVVAENIKYDFAILSFLSDKKLAVAKMADENILEQVRVFDKIFTIGCQMGHAPTPTTGIISQILTGNNGEKEWVIYCNTAHISLGSSGGGLFKKHNNHYYLIGIPFRLMITSNGQIVPHLSYAISITTARDFINKNSVSK